MRFCKDCKWCSIMEQALRFPLAICTHERAMTTRQDMVTGETQRFGTPCDIERQAQGPGVCGKESAWFELREGGANPDWPEAVFLDPRTVLE